MGLGSDNESQLDRIEGMLDARLAGIEARLANVDAALTQLNGKVARHQEEIAKHEERLRGVDNLVAQHQTELYGRPGHTGMTDDVRVLVQHSQLRGTITVRSVWTAIATLSAVSAVVVSLVLGLAAS